MMMDRNCPNQSFKNMRYVLQEQKIQQNEFMLELKNKMLQDIDLVENEKINETDNVIKAIRDEIGKNIWFFMRRILRVPTTYGSILHHFELTPLGMAIIWLYEHNFSIVIVEDKQLPGLKTILAAIDTYRYITGRKSYANTSPVRYEHVSPLATYREDKVNYTRSNSVYLKSLALMSTIPDILKIGIDVKHPEKNSIYPELATADFSVNSSTPESRDIAIQFKNACTFAIPTDESNAPIPQYISTLNLGNIAFDLDMYSWLRETTTLPFSALMYDWDEKMLESEALKSRFKPILIDRGVLDIVGFNPGIM